MNRVCDFYNRHFLVIELALAAIVATAFYACIQIFWSNDGLVLFLSGSRQAVYTGIASLTGSLLGFVIASVPIVLGFSQSPRLKAVRESPHYAEVFRIFFQAIYWLSLAAVWALVGTFADTDKRP